MENRFKESRLIEQVMVIGEGEKHPSALIMPAEDGVKFWCKKHNITFSTLKEVIQNQKVLDKFETELEYYNNFFNPYERVKKFKILPDPWSVDGGELTATMKLRRKNISDKYKQICEDIYRS